MLGVIAAMDKEVEAITALMEERTHVVVSGIQIAKGRLCNKPLLVMKSGVGKGNASMSTTILLENFKIDNIINIGTAGGLLPIQNVLDAVISDRVVQYDYDTSAVDGEAGIGLYFQSDPDLAKLCERALKNMGVPLHRGLIASGDQFIAREEQLKFLETTFPDAICAEMEAGAIAQVCAHYQLPFVVLRSLSDIAHKEGSHMDFMTYVTHASKRSATFCKEFMNLIA